MSKRNRPASRSHKKRPQRATPRAAANRNASLLTKKHATQEKHHGKAALKNLSKNVMNIVAVGTLVVSVITLQISRESNNVSAHNAQESNTINAQGGNADQFNAAIQKLGDQSNSDLRLGGISDLSTLLDTAPQYHDRIISQLAAFVRDHDPVTLCTNRQGGVPTDIREAVDVIGGHNNWSPKSSDYYADLSFTCLAGLALNDANLDGTNLIGTDLQYSDLNGTSLSNANLLDADLSSGEFQRTDFTCALLPKANLNKAWLLAAKLYGADLIRVDLTDALVDDADLTDAVVSYANLTGTGIKDTDIRQDSQIPCVRSLGYQEAITR